MKKSTILNFLIICICWYYSSNVLAKTIPTINDEQLSETVLTYEDLTIADEAWFHKAFVESFFDNYKDKAMWVNVNGYPKLLASSTQDLAEKKAWLLATAKEVFDERVAKNENSTNKFAFKILSNGHPLGAMLYDVNDEANYIYIAQLFVVTEAQGNGLATRAFFKELLKRYPKIKTYYAVTRHQNTASVGFFLHHLNFKISDNYITKKFGYDPKRYKALQLELGEY